LSESQKREAKRLVEILKVTGFLKEGLRGKNETLRCEVREEVWINELTQAIAIYQGEELAKAWGKLLIQRMERKDKE